MRYEEIIKWSTIAVSCGAAIQLALFLIPALRGPGALIQILLAFAACAALAVIVANDRRNNGDLTRGGGRDELKMIGMFFVLWLAFAVMFRMSGIGAGASAPASSAAAQRGSHNRDRNTGRDSRDYNDNFGRRCRGSYCVYEEWYY